MILPELLMPAASRENERLGYDVRSATSQEIVARIEGDFRNWDEAAEPHPSDESADSCIARLRAASGRHGTTAATAATPAATAATPARGIVRFS
jgi:hypothetical protein